jgi:hypothetical protein
MVGITGQSLPALALDPDLFSTDCRPLVVARRPSEFKAEAAWRYGLAKTGGRRSEVSNFERKEKGRDVFAERLSMIKIGRLFSAIRTEVRHRSGDGILQVARHSIPCPLFDWSVIHCWRFLSLRASAFRYS